MNKKDRAIIPTKAKIAAEQIIEIINQDLFAQAQDLSSHFPVAAQRLNRKAVKESAQIIERIFLDKDQTP